MTLRHKFISGAFWSTVERFGQQGIQFVIAIIIARILTPSDYGLIGMLAIFIAIAQSFVDSGFGSALIQKQDANQTDFSTIFYFNIAVSTLFYFIFFFTAPLIAKFYNQPLLTPITRVMALNIVVNSFGLIQNSILTKNINFKTLTKVSLSSIVVSGAIGVFMAYKGFGVWALVYQTLGGSVIKTISLWFYNKWRPAFAFSFESLKSLFSYGSKLLASGLLNQIFDNIYKLIIGKLYSPTNLGFYTQAKRLQEISVTNLYAIPQRVTFPLYSIIQKDDLRLKELYRRTAKAIMYFNFPIMFILIIMAPLLIKLFLTEKWLPCTTYFRLFCLGGLIYPLTGINLNISKVKGRTDIFLLLQVIKIVSTLIALIITFKFGILIMVIGEIISLYFCFIVNMYFSGSLIRYTINEQLIDIMPYFILNFSIFSVFYLLSCLSKWDNFWVWLYLVISIILYFWVSRLFKIDSYYEIASSFKYLRIFHKA